VARKLTYEENDFKGEIVNIYQNPQELINYLIDTISNEGDWVFDLFSYEIILHSLLLLLLFLTKTIIFYL
jgi:hypothetical protein